MKLKYIPKYWKWVKREWKLYNDNKVFSKEYAKISLDFEIAMLLDRSQAEIDQKASRKHEWVLRYLESVCSDTIEKYRNMEFSENVKELQKETRVWSMFWQGEEHADKLFRMCIDSARKHTKSQVTVLSKDNYKDYFEIPENILKKYHDGKIMVQHICDLMVVSILAEHGGFFTGATVYWTQDVEEEVLKAPFYTCRAISDRPFFMSRSRWVGYVLAGNKEFPLYSFSRDCLQEYWEKKDQAVDYLMLDYIFELAYRHIPCVKEMIDALPDNNLLRNTLINELGNPYDEEEFKKFTEGDTFMYKLSWKFGDKDEILPDGRETNYGYMLKNWMFEMESAG